MGGHASKKNIFRKKKPAERREVFFEVFQVFFGVFCFTFESLVSGARPASHSLAHDQTAAVFSQLLSYILKQMVTPKSNVINALFSN